MNYGLTLCLRESELKLTLEGIFRFLFFSPNGRTCHRFVISLCKTTRTEAAAPHLLGRRDALLLVELGGLLGLDLQAEALLEGLVLQHEGRAEPEVVGLAQVLQHAGPDGDGGHALRHGLHEAVQGARLAVALHLVAAAAQERADLPRQGLPGEEGERRQLNSIQPHPSIIPPI